MEGRKKEGTERKVMRGRVRDVGSLSTLTLQKFIPNNFTFPDFVIRKVSRVQRPLQEVLNTLRTKVSYCKP